MIENNYHFISPMLESRSIFSFNSLKPRAPLLVLKCKQEAFLTCDFPRNGIIVLLLIQNIAVGFCSF